VKHDDALVACWRAREAWHAAGQPGQQHQLAFFGELEHSPPEVIRGLRADRPRRRRKRTQ
jgi:hypothetical protein